MQNNDNFINKNTVSDVVNQAQEWNPDRDGWSVPDLSLVSGEGSQPPVLPENCLPPEWYDWAKAHAKAKGCPVDFVVLNLLVFASGWLGNARHVSATDDWIEPPHIWGAIVAPPSGGKTPSQVLFVGGSKQLEADDKPEWEEALATYNRDIRVADEKRKNWEASIVKAVKDKNVVPNMPEELNAPEKPSKPRMLIREATMQKAVDLLSQNPKGLILHRDEMSGWISGMDKYTNSQGADRSFYLECWSGGSYSVDLVKNGEKTTEVPYASLSIIGGFQPDKLRQAISGADDGLAARFLYVWPVPEGYVPLNLADEESEIRWAYLLRAARKLRRLEMIDGEEDDKPRPVVRSLSPDAMPLLESLREAAFVASSNTKGLAAGWHGKTPARVLRLSLVIEYLAWAQASDETPEPQTVSQASVRYACTYLDYLDKMFDRIIGGLAIDPAEHDAVPVMKLILCKKLSHINERELYQTSGHTYLRDNKRRQAAFNVLKQGGWVKRVAPQGIGRKRSDWLVNPALFEKGI